MQQPIIMTKDSTQEHSTSFSVQKPSSSDASVQSTSTRPRSPPDDAALIRKAESWPLQYDDDQWREISVSLELHKPRLSNYNPSERVQDLSSFLDKGSPEYKHLRHHKNIRAAIEAHKNGSLREKPEVWFVDGEMFTEEPPPKVTLKYTYE